MRTKKALINTIAGLSIELVSLICGLILPRLILSEFGSSYNGITSSITQFLSVVALLKSGIGGVTKAALYKPLAEKNYDEISEIIKATEIFLRKVAIVFVLFLIVFAFTYPIFVNDEFEWFFSFSLVLIIGISTFFQYYFGLTYQMLLTADQKQYVVSYIQIVTTILNTIVACILIKSGSSIHTVKLGSAVVFCINPLFFNLYAKRKYKIKTSAKPNYSTIKQRWDAVHHQIANFVYTNTDIIVLTIFTNIKEVSVYTVYYLVINSLTSLIKNIIGGLSAAFGNMLAVKDDSIGENFNIFELVVFSISTILFICCALLIVPFVTLYTKGINDVNYYRPLFAILISIGAFFGAVRLPYQQVVDAAGHYKQTKKMAIAEAVINLTLSIILVYKYGLIGVTIGTIFATVSRTIYYSIYLSKNIIKRSNLFFYKHLIISIVICVVVIIIENILPKIEVINYFDWLILSIRIFVETTLVVLISDLLFYRKDTKNCISKILNVMFHKN